MRKLLVLLIACTVAFTTFGCGGSKSAAPGASKADQGGRRMTPRERRNAEKQQTQQQGQEKAAGAK